MVFHDVLVGTLLCLLVQVVRAELDDLKKKLQESVPHGDSRAIDSRRVQTVFG